MNHFRYWYRSAYDLCRISRKHVHSVRRKAYTAEEEMRKEVTEVFIGNFVNYSEIEYRCFVRKWKLKRLAEGSPYKPELCFNIDEVKTYMDMAPKMSYGFKNKPLVGSNTNSHLLRYTSMLGGSVTEKFPLALLYRNFSDREQNLACDILGEDTWVCDNVYQNDTATFDEEMYLEYLEDVVAPYLRKHGGGVDGTERAAFFYDIATHHRTPKVKRWMAKHKCDRFEIHANFTWKWQLVDVALAVNLF